MNENCWQVRFKIKDKRLYGKGKSVLYNMNITVPTDVAISTITDVIPRWISEFEAKRHAEKLANSVLTTAPTGYDL